MNILLFPIRANPDNERLYPRVSRWLLEIDTENGHPTREIGVAEDGSTVLGAPDHRNCGWWTWSPDLEPTEADWWHEYGRASEEEFLSRWEGFYGSTDERPWRHKRPFDWQPVVFALLALGVAWLLGRLIVLLVAEQI